jgi:galactan 5-O-arabinofuranosyltransferase
MGHAVPGNLLRPTGSVLQSKPAEPPATHLTLGRTLAELLLAGVCAVVLSLVLQLGVGRMHVGPGTYVPDALANLACAVIVVVLFALVAFGWAARWPLWLKLAGAWSALSMLATALLAIPLQTTRFFLGGSGVDNTFRLQYMARMASTTALADVNYRDLPAYYPGGWFWLGGRFANLLGVDGWVAYKPYSIVWAALTGVIAFVLWSLVLRRNLALLAATATMLAGSIAMATEEPYAWPTAAWLPPVALLAWQLFRRRARTPAWPLVLIGVYLGFSAITYTLHLAFGLVVLLVLAVLAGILDARGGEPLGPLVRRLFARLAMIGVISGLSALVTWAPFILAGGLGKPNVAAHFLPEIGAYLPTPFVPDSAFGVLCLAGLVWLPLRISQPRPEAVDAPGRDVAFVLLIITAAAYAWFALSTLAIFLNTTLLGFRFIVTVDVVLAIAGLFAAVDILRTLPRVLGSTKSIRAIGFVLAAAGAVSLAQTSVASSRGMIAAAESDYYADGFNAKGEQDLTQDGAWTGELITAINQLSGRPPTENTVLSSYDRLLSFQPYWGFQQSTPHYANPLAAYQQRNDEIRYWASSFNSGELLTRLASNPHRPPNVFVLRRTDGPSGSKLALAIAFDSFPQAAPVRFEQVDFDRRLFDSPRFAQKDVGPFVVIVRR